MFQTLIVHFTDGREISMRVPALCEVGEKLYVDRIEITAPTTAPSDTFVCRYCRHWAQTDNLFIGRCDVNDEIVGDEDYCTAWEVRT